MDQTVQNGAAAPKPRRKQKAKETKPKRSGTSRILPSDRITFSRQLDILRSYAVASGPTTKPVSLNNVANIAKMVASTVSMANAFFTDVGLLSRTNGGGFTPAPEVLAFHRAFQWNPNTAAHKLAPLFSETWFAQGLLPRITLQPVPEDEALTILGEVAEAGPEYRSQLRFLLDYLAVAGLITREAGQVQAAESASHQTNQTPEPANEHDQDTVADSRVPQRTATVATSYSTAPTEGVVQFHVSVRVDMSELEGWRPDRIAAFFGGIAQVLAAKGQIEGESHPKP